MSICSSNLIPLLLENLFVYSIKTSGPVRTYLVKISFSSNSSSENIVVRIFKLYLSTKIFFFFPPDIYFDILFIIYNSLTFFTRSLKKFL